MAEVDYTYTGVAGHSYEPATRNAPFDYNSVMGYYRESHGDYSYHNQQHYGTGHNAPYHHSAPGHHHSQNNEGSRYHHEMRHSGTHPERRSHHSGNHVSNPNVVHHHAVADVSHSDSHKNLLHQTGKSHNKIKENPNKLPSGKNSNKDVWTEQEIKNAASGKAAHPHQVYVKAGTSYSALEQKYFSTSNGSNAQGNVLTYNQNNKKGIWGIKKGTAFIKKSGYISV